MIELLEHVWSLGNDNGLMRLFTVLVALSVSLRLLGIISIFIDGFFEWRGKK